MGMDDVAREILENDARDTAQSWAGDHDTVDSDDDQSIMGQQLLVKHSPVPVLEGRSQQCVTAQGRCCWLSLTRLPSALLSRAQDHVPRVSVSDGLPGVDQHSSLWSWCQHCNSRAAWSE